MTEAVKVSIHGQTVGFLTWDSRKGRALFEYDRTFVSDGLDIAPICMPIHCPRSKKGMIWLGNEDKLYKGLPPTFADSLPDKWGSTLFAKWVTQNNLRQKDITKQDLLEVGKRQDISNCTALYEEVESSLAQIPQIASELEIHRRFILCNPSKSV